VRYMTCIPVDKDQTGAIDINPVYARSGSSALEGAMDT
jgi:hypothetical protein